MVDTRVKYVYGSLWCLAVICKNHCTFLTSLWSIAKYRWSFSQLDMFITLTGVFFPFGVSSYSFFSTFATSSGSNLNLYTFLVVHQAGKSSLLSRAMFCKKSKRGCKKKLRRRWPLFDQIWISVWSASPF